MSHAIIITGMHRSGTSLISSLLQSAGVHIGEKLLAANTANPRGYFEDVDFYEYHEHLLHQRGQTYLHVNSNFTFQPTDSETERARQLIAERSHRPVWGWKDPRTSLFLDFWHQLLPDGRFLFVYRHPIEVLLSLLRRGEFDNHPSLMAGLHAWYKYNSSIQNFLDRHPDRCLLVHIDGVVKESARFVQLLHEKLQLDSSLGSEALARIYHASELQKTPFSPELTATLARLYPELLELYQQLNQKADLRCDETETDSPPSAYMSQLAHFTEHLAEPISAPVKHSLVQLLLSSLAPEFTGRMFDRFDHSAKEMQQKVDYLWLQVQRLERLNAEQTQELDRLHGLNSETNSALDRLQRLNTEQGQELAHLQRMKVEQGQELERLQRLKADQDNDLDRLQRIEAEQQQELERLQRLNAEQSQTLDCLQWLNVEQIQELERQSVHIESLVTELDSIRGTRVWKAMQSYRKLKERWKKAA